MQAWARLEIDKLRRAWLWRGDEACHGGHCKVAWRRICRPKQLGGLGILDLWMFGAALRLRWLWLERTAPEQPWVRLPTPCSMTDRLMFTTATRCRLGSGKRACFWLDAWLDGQAPCLIGPDIFNVVSNKRRAVASALADSRWVRDLQGRITIDTLPSFFALWVKVAALAPLTTDVVDSFECHFSANGCYSAASAYRLQFVGSMSYGSMTTIWRAWAPAKHKFSAWLLAQNRIMTADRLTARQWPNSYFCPLCWRNLETAEHLMRLGE